MSQFTFKMFTKSLHSIHEDQSTDREIEVCFNAYWNQVKEDMEVEIEYIWDIELDKSLEGYPVSKDKPPYELTKEDLQAIDERIDEVCNENFGEISEDSMGSDIDHAMDLMEDR